MDIRAHGELTEVDGTRVLVYRAARRMPPAEALLGELLGESAGVPARDVELSRDCVVCGQQHGRPTVVYPTTPSGGPWYADARIVAGLAVVAAAPRVPLGVGLVRRPLAVSPAVDDAAFHPIEREALAALAAEDLEAARALLWVRKAAILNAIGHSSVLEPSRLALALPGEETIVLRSVPELDALGAFPRFHDLDVGGEHAASVAVVG